MKLTKENKLFILNYDGAYQELPIRHRFVYCKFEIFIGAEFYDFIENNLNCYDHILQAIRERTHSNPPFNGPLWLGLNIDNLAVAVRAQESWNPPTYVPLDLREPIVMKTKWLNTMAKIEFAAAMFVRRSIAWLTSNFANAGCFAAIENSNDEHPHWFHTHYGAIPQDSVYIYPCNTGANYSPVTVPANVRSEFSQDFVWVPNRGWYFDGEVDVLRRYTNSELLTHLVGDHSEPFIKLTTVEAFNYCNAIKLEGQKAQFKQFDVGWTCLDRVNIKIVPATANIFSNHLGRFVDLSNPSA